MKIAIVTGASGNLGQAVVRKFIDKGFKVIGTVIPNDPVALDFPADQFEKQVVDLLNEEDSKKFISSVISTYGAIDAAVMTVGGFAMGNIDETSTADIQKQYKLNFETAYNVARPVFVQMMKQKKGRIYVIGSKPGLDAQSGQGMVAYGLTKSLIIRLAEIMNLEAKGHNVVTSVVIPSTIDTPQNRKANPDTDFSNWVKPEDIANVIHYYCTDEAAALRDDLIKVYNNS